MRNAYFLDMTELWRHRAVAISDYPALINEDMYVNFLSMCLANSSLPMPRPEVEINAVKVIMSKVEGFISKLLMDKQAVASLIAEQLIPIYAAIYKAMIVANIDNIENYDDIFYHNNYSRFYTNTKKYLLTTSIKAIIHLLEEMHQQQRTEEDPRVQALINTMMKCYHSLSLTKNKKLKWILELTRFKRFKDIAVIVNDFKEVSDDKSYEKLVKNSQHTVKDMLTRSDLLGQLRLNDNLIEITDLLLENQQYELLVDLFELYKPVQLPMAKEHLIRMASVVLTQDKEIPELKSVTDWMRGNLSADLIKDGIQQVNARHKLSKLSDIDSLLKHLEKNLGNKATIVKDKLLLEICFKRAAEFDLEQAIDFMDITLKRLRPYQPIDCYKDFLRLMTVDKAKIFISHVLSQNYFAKIKFYYVEATYQTRFEPELRELLLQILRELNISKKYLTDNSARINNEGLANTLALIDKEAEDSRSQSHNLTLLDQRFGKVRDRYDPEIIGATMPLLLSLKEMSNEALSEEVVEILKDAPVPLQLAIQDRSENPSKTAQAFSRFIMSYDKADDQADEEHQFDRNVILYTTAFQLVNLYQIMGDSCFDFLRKYIGGKSTSEFNRFFESYKIIDQNYHLILSSILEKHSKEILHPEHFIAWENILFCASNFELLELEIRRAGAQPSSRQFLGLAVLNQVMKESKTLHEISINFQRRLGEKYLDVLGISNTDKAIAIDQILAVPNMIVRLLEARYIMSQNKYKDVFDMLIRVDVSKDLDFWKVMTDVNQSDPVCKRLAVHNQGVMAALKNAGINVELALNYNTKKTFSVQDIDTLDYSPFLRAIWADLILLRDAFPKPYAKKSLPALINNCLEQLTKGKKTRIADVPDLKSKDSAKLHSVHFDRMLKTPFLKLVIDLLKKYARLDKTSKEIGEFGHHLADHFRQLINILSGNDVNFHETKINWNMFIDELSNDMNKIGADQQQKPAQHQETRQFTAELWDKADIRSLLKGNYMDCCLATNSTQFPATVQRRMDIGMMTPVVIDHSIGEPICCNWLFFGADKNNPKDVYVVANFFDMRGRYVRKPEIRDKLMKELQLFTGNYAKAINAKGFIIRPLEEYSPLNDYKFPFSLKKIQVTKVGGFFSADPKASSEHVKQLYYLDALNIDEFYAYSETRLLSSKKPIPSVKETQQPSLWKDEEAKKSESKRSEIQQKYSN